MKKLMFIAVFILSYLNIAAQEVAPLQRGNTWVYDVGFQSMRKISVIDTNVIIDSIYYSKLSYVSNHGHSGFQHFRLTEAGYYAALRDTGYPAPNHELLYYKKDAKKGDRWTIPSRYNPADSAVYTVQDTILGYQFGEEVTVKYITIYEANGAIILDTYWADKFGFLSSFDFGWTLESLIGCVIDGVVYGDTSFTVVSVEDDLLSNGFYLSQNYPNPFNPTTTIEYTIPQGGYITLEVFNMLGEQIKTLVKGYKQPGKHSIEFKAEALASGTYVYVFSTTNSVTSKTMQLLK